MLVVARQGPCSRCTRVERTLEAHSYVWASLMATKQSGLTPEAYNVRATFLELWAEKQAYQVRDFATFCYYLAANAAKYCEKDAWGAVTGSKLIEREGCVGLWRESVNLPDIQKVGTLILVIPGLN